MSRLARSIEAGLRTRLRESRGDWFEMDGRTEYVGKALADGTVKMTSPDGRVRRFRIRVEEVVTL